jgi:chemotaxis protein histidine kinase CheA
VDPAGQESAVIRPLGAYLRHCPGLPGATISRDGRVRLVLDPAGLVAAAEDLPFENPAFAAPAFSAPGFTANRNFA